VRLAVTFSSHPRVRLVSTHDALFRAVFDNVSSCADLVRAALPGNVVAAFDLETLEIERGSFITDPLRARFSDLLLSVRAHGEPVLLHLLFEHKSKAERFTVLDLFDNVAAIWKTWRANHPTEPTIPRVLPIVVHHGPKRWNQAKEIPDLFAGDEDLLATLAPLDPSLPVVFFDLGGVTDPDREIERLRDPLARLALFLLMISRTRDLLEHLKRRGFDLLRVVWHAPDGRLRAIPVLDYVLRHLSTEVRTNEFAAMLHDHVAPEAEEAVRSLADVLFDRGVERGRAEGKAEGKAEGRAEGEILAILRVLSTRFGHSAESLRPRIAAIGDSELLLRLVVLAATADSLESFARELRDG